MNWKFLIPLLASLAIFGCLGEGTPSQVEPPGIPLKEPVSHPPITGTSSCSSRGCHGNLNLEEKSAPFSPGSYSRWLQNDPHFNGHKALTTDLGKEIGRKLGINSVAEDPRCVACHATPQTANGGEWAKDEHRFGVGCESCHGSALKWFETHKSDSWKQQGETEKVASQIALGMNPLSNLSARAKVCAGCHIGAPANPSENIPVRDMNHDFIAAGHPRLMFEFGAYLANEPKHWIEKQRNKDYDFEVRAWFIGQLISGQSALELLIDRVETQRVWPEFSEYDCYACHHSLARPSWRQGNETNSLGKLRINRWYYDLVEVLTDKPFSLASLDNLMSGRIPPKDLVLKEAKKLHQTLGQLATDMEKRDFSLARLAQLRSRLATRGALGKDLGWDEMEQLALGIKAITQSEGNVSSSVPGQAPPDQALKKINLVTDSILQKLAFSHPSNSPLHFRQSPEWEKELIMLFESLR